MILNTHILVPALDFSHDLKKAKFFLSHLHRLINTETDLAKKERLITETSALLERLLQTIENETNKEREYGKTKLS